MNNGDIHTILDRHQNTYMELSQLGSVYPDYQPNYQFVSPFINTFHEKLAQYPLKNGRLILIRSTASPYKILRWWIRDILVDIRNLYRFGNAIPGWLLPQEALKLYELAYFADGDVLELGSYHGLSTHILAQACKDSPKSKTLYTVDLDPACVSAMIHNLRKMDLVRGVVSLVDDGVSAIRRFTASGLKFSFAFIDHSHKYEHVLNVCHELPNVMSQGGIVLFHDFNNPANKDPNNTQYGVFQAVSESMDRNIFDFYGIYGGAGLYRFK